MYGMQLPDASQGAEHLREVFYRMGFNDREIVALSGGHTLGRCHGKTIVDPRMRFGKSFLFVAQLLDLDLMDHGHPIH